jgi:hypothetical protein
MKPINKLRDQSYNLAINVLVRIMRNIIFKYIYFVCQKKKKYIYFVEWFISEKIHKPNALRF